MMEEVIQELWSGYGEIVRLPSQTHGTVIVKRVRASKASNHPRGWATNRSHDRKVRSYQVETTWYRDYSERCDARCRVPKCLGLEENASGLEITLEDLDAAGYPLRRTVGAAAIGACLNWLANFHATFMGIVPEGLWPIGTYWHLDTRPDELESLDDLPLKEAAAKIDATLNAAKFQTFVHGDAKLANFCFSKDGTEVAGVDFQYVGGGCGMKDVAYFIGSCLDQRACEAQESALLATYFAALRESLAVKQPDINADDVVNEWRALYPVAWTDFHRFLKGWSPGHWKINGYSERVAREVVASIT